MGGRSSRPAASLQLTAMRGEMPITIPAREFDLTLADGPREGGPFRVEVVNAMGAGDVERAGGKRSRGRKGQGDAAH